MVWNTSAFQLLIITATGGFTGLFVYSPIPGPNNLVSSITPQGGTDPYGNAYLAGETVYGLVGGTYFAMQMTTGGVRWWASVTEAGPWSQVASGFTIDSSNSLLASANGNVSFTAGQGLASPTKLLVESSGYVLVTAGLDGNTYNTGPALKTKSANQTITNVSAAVTWDQGANTLAVAAGVTYRLRALIRTHQDPANTPADNLQFTVSGAVSFSSLSWFAGGIGSSMGGWSVTPLNVNFGTAPVADAQVVTYVEGIFQCSAAGTLTLFAQSGTPGTSFIVQQGTFMELIPAVAVN